MYVCTDVCVCMCFTNWLSAAWLAGRKTQIGLQFIICVTVFEQAALSHALTLLNLALEASGIALTNTATASSRAVETRSFKSG